MLAVLLLVAMEAEKFLLLHPVRNTCKSAPKRVVLALRGLKLFTLTSFPVYFRDISLFQNAIP